MDVLHRELYEDVAVRARADRRPWRPIAAGPGSPFVVPEESTASFFSVEALESGELAGEAVLWGLDTHNRFAHLGLALRPAFRGKGLSTDVVRALCFYGFSVLGLHRLQIDTLADNAAMLAAARRAGFTLEGTLRESTWAYGSYVDEVALGLLADEWASGR